MAITQQATSPNTAIGAKSGLVMSGSTWRLSPTYAVRAVQRPQPG
jgi:hypothetical protein